MKSKYKNTSKKITKYLKNLHSPLTFGLIRRHHLSLSLLPAEKVELFSTSPISSRQKEKLLIVHM
jgi:hypothetical protein